MNRFQILKGEEPPPKKPPVYQARGVYPTHSLKITATIDDPKVIETLRSWQSLKISAVRNDPVSIDYSSYARYHEQNIRAALGVDEQIRREEQLLRANLGVNEQLRREETDG